MYRIGSLALGGVRLTAPPTAELALGQFAASSADAASSGKTSGDDTVAIVTVIFKSVQAALPAWRDVDEVEHLHSAEDIERFPAPSQGTPCSACLVS